jgi:hypothetical protein
MIDFEEDEEGPRQRPHPSSGDSGDRIVGAFFWQPAAAFFPWYVFFNQESFGIAPMGIFRNPRSA